MNSGVLHVWPVINFLVLLGGLIYFIKPPLKKVLIERSETIQKNVSESKSLYENAVQNVKSFEEKLKNLDQEILAMKMDSKKQVEEQKQKILEDANKQALSIIQNAKLMMEKDILLEKENIQKNLMGEVVAQVVERLKNTSTVEHHEHYYNQFIESIEKEDQHVS